MRIWQAAVLGIVQGFAEFLPVSSSGHLVLLQRIMGLEGDLLFFDTMLHLGTLAAVFIVMWPEIRAILRKPLQRATAYIALATLPLVVATALFGDFFEAAFEGGLLGVGFLVTSLVLFAMMFVREGRYAMEDMGWGRALMVGTVQVMAVLPGISRSGSTIFGGRLTGLSAESSARFAFLMSIPAILGSVVWQARDVLKQGVGSDVPWLGVVVGMAMAGVTGYFAMKLLIDMVKKGKLWYFGIYTAALGILVLVDQLVLRTWF